jgi:argininosuccinate lyase
MKEAKVIQTYLKDLIAAMVERADSEVDALMPGYTHLQVRDPTSTVADSSELNRSDGHIGF